MDELLLFQLLFTVIAVVSFFVINGINHRLMHSIAKYKKTTPERVEHILKYFRIVMLVILFIMIIAVWGIDYRGLLLFASSILAVLGVALFAQWSLLSNITAGVIIFFSFPARIGDKVEIIDGNTSLVGTIIEITIFQVILRDEKGFELSYPNSLVLQKPVRKMGRDELFLKQNKRTSIHSRIEGR